ncbi:MAG: DUF1800 family protein [Spirosomataceae bacterium]
MILLSFLFIHSVFILNVKGQTVRQIGKGTQVGVQVRTSSGQGQGTNTLSGTGFQPNYAAASRFLAQSTFGATWNEIVRVERDGIEPWLRNQFQRSPAFFCTPYVQKLHQTLVDSLNQRSGSTTNTLANTFVPAWYFDVAWFQGVMQSEDALRWRVAFALSQILVTSRISAFDDNPYALASYHDVLYRNAFGNFRQLIDSVTFHPAMAVYLTYMNNRATDVERQTYPDENYAREIMQLFTIGLFQLNPNGTEKRDALNRPIPTYDNTDIAGLAKVFTGLSWGDATYLGQRETNRMSYTLPLRFFPIDSSDAKRNPWKRTPRIVPGHEPGSKTFLGFSTPNRTPAQGLLDIKDALDVLVNHPNTAPFISLRLIQHLVTSNPSADFVGRVSSVFANNGQGVRGDLRAVIQAILLDPEARACCSEADPVYKGHLREPILRYLNLVKGLELKSPTQTFRNSLTEVNNLIGQIPLNSPSVFNFYQPTYVPDGPLVGTGKVAPEFQTLSSQSFTGYLNGLHRWIFDNNVVDYRSYFSNESIKHAERPGFDLSNWFPLTLDQRLPELIDRLGLILAQGQITLDHRNLVEQTVRQMPLNLNANQQPDPTLADRRVRMAIFLLMASPDYMIKR